MAQRGRGKSDRVHVSAIPAHRRLILQPALSASLRSLALRLAAEAEAARMNEIRRPRTASPVSPPVVYKWIGHAAKTAEKHYLQVTDDHFERAAKPGAGAVKNPVQQPAAPFCTESAEST